MKILFAGGGTLGPVSPLLAVTDVWKKKDPTVSFVWAGTTKGPERIFIEREGIQFFSIATARFPRYLSFEWVFFPFCFFYACLQSFILLICERPKMICAAGGYTSVPIILIGSLFRIPSWIHQSDVVPVLTNRLLAPFVSLITVAWPETQKAFPKHKTYVVGNPVRVMMTHGSPDRARVWIRPDKTKPVVLIFGGGTGSQWLNQKAQEMQKTLCKFANVVHVTGRGKSEKIFNTIHPHVGCYVVKELLNIEEMADVFSLTDIVVCRAGTGTITELAACKKAAIVIPLPHSSQQQNARLIQEGVIVCNQEKISAEDLLNEIRLLLIDDPKRKKLGETIYNLLPTNVAGKIIDLILSLKEN